MNLLQDVRFGLRILARSPGFAILAIVTLGLGIGANSTVFTLVNGVFLRGLPFDRPEEIVRLRTVTEPQGFRGAFSWPEYRDIAEQARSFQGLAAYTSGQGDISDPGAPADRLRRTAMTANAFPLLGQQPALGRLFTEEDRRVGAAPVALISHSVWQSRYGGDPAVLGRTIRVDRQPYTVIGVMPEGEAFPDGTDVWIPLVPGADEEDRRRRTIAVFGRLSPGVSFEQANVEVGTIADSLARTWPESNENTGAVVTRYTDLGEDAEIRAVFTALHGAVTFVLLIACANVANLLLSRTVGRTRETSIRAALGASRGRIVRQLLVESLVMSLAGGALGLGLAALGIRTFWNAVRNTGPPYWLRFPIDLQVLVYFMVVCAVSAILFGLAPALQVSRTDVNEHLKEGGRGSTGGIRSRRLTGALLIGQIAMTLILLVGAGLMIRSFLNTQRSDPGFAPDGLLTARLAPPGPAYPEDADRVALQDRILARLEAIPGLDSVTLASSAPVGGVGRRRLALEDAPVGEGEELPWTGVLSVSPSYFRTMALGIRTGRDFGPADGRPGSEVAVVNELFAETHWPGSSPLGRRIRLSEDADAPWIEIVGVSPPVLQSSSERGVPEPVVYIPAVQEPSFEPIVIVRSGRPPEEVARALREEVRLIDPDMPLYDVRTAREELYLRNWPYRVFGALFGIFALIALLMSSVGIYGVTSYAIARRRDEIGIRMALGARRRDILGLVLRQGLIRIAVGTVLGLAGALLVSRLLESILIDVSATDPLTFVVISLILAAVTLTACLVPAGRAVRLDPAEALRTE